MQPLRTAAWHQGHDARVPFVSSAAVQMQFWAAALCRVVIELLWSFVPAVVVLQLTSNKIRSLLTSHARWGCSLLRAPCWS